MKKRYYKVLDNYLKIEIKADLLYLSKFLEVLNDVVEGGKVLLNNNTLGFYYTYDHKMYFFYYLSTKFYLNSCIIRSFKNYNQNTKKTVIRKKVIIR